MPEISIFGAPQLAFSNQEHDWVAEVKAAVRVVDEPDVMVVFLVPH